jgi:hypothetical protein
MGATALKVESAAPSKALGVESYGAEIGRLRLTNAETRWLRYVLCEWDGECGAGSNLGSQLEKLAQKPRNIPRAEFVVKFGDGGYLGLSPQGVLSVVSRARAERFILRGDAEQYATAYATHRAHRVVNLHKCRHQTRADADTPAWRLAWERDAQTMYVPGATPSSHERVWPAEAWADRRLDAREATLRCWRALGAVAWRDGSILRALYGNRPPDMALAGMWGKAVDEEYRRVVRLVVGDRFEPVVIRRKRGVEEGENAYRTRLASETADRAAQLRAAGEKCERAIVAASVSYRAAWREVGK